MTYSKAECFLRIAPMHKKSNLYERFSSNMRSKYIDDKCGAVQAGKKYFASEYAIKNNAVVRKSEKPKKR